LTIVPNLNVLKDRRASQSAGGELADNTFGFEGTKETFYDCIIITVAHPAHTQFGQGSRQTPLPGLRYDFYRCTGQPEYLVSMQQLQANLLRRDDPPNPVG
jgi:hypothetical protein